MSTTTNMEIELIDGSDYISPEPINAGFTKLDVLGVDYVVERAQSGDWWYRKWHSGFMEIYGTVSVTGTPTSTGYIQAKTPYPIAFSNVYSAIATPIFNSWSTFAVDVKHPVEESAALTQAIVTFWIREDKRTESRTYKASIYTTGMYK